MVFKKGGASKTTTCGIVANELSKDHKVLAIDLDSQGNLTSMLTQRNIFDFDGKTSLEAMREHNAMKYVQFVNPNLDILPSNDLMATFQRWLYTKYRGDTNLVVKRTIEEAKQYYDYILIDTPPALSEQTINSMIASDYLVILFETSQFCYDAIDRYMETYELIKKEFSAPVQIAGILTNIIDSRRNDTNKYIEAIDRNYPGLRFATEIKRSADTSRLAKSGFQDPRLVKQAVKPYLPFIEELKERVNHE